MTNEAIWKYASPVTLVACGASTASAAFGRASDSGIGSAQSLAYPYADFTLVSIGYSAALGTGKYIGLYARQLNQANSGSLDVSSPQANFKSKYVGAFTLTDSLASTGTFVWSLEDVPIGEDQEYYVENQAGVTLNQGWQLFARPKSLVPAT